MKQYKIKLSKKQIKELETLEDGQTLEVICNGTEAYITPDDYGNFSLSGKRYLLNFFCPSEDQIILITPKAPTVWEFLHSSEFAKSFKCWGYANRIYYENGESVHNNGVDLGNDEEWEKFTKSHEVARTETGWELGDDHESYAFCKIFVKGVR